MKLYYKLIVFLLLPTLIFANNGKFKGKYTKEKTIKKEFNVSSDALLKIDNSYGNVDVATWNENRTVIEVRILTNGNDEKKVLEKLDEITVKFSATNSLVSAETIFSDSKGWNLWGSNNNVSMEINYTIKIPMTNSVELDNNYGAISIKKLMGNSKIDCDYGQLIIGELLGGTNLLNFNYTNNSTIGYMKSGKIYADYSSFILEKAENIEVFADYTDTEILEANNLIYICDYGKITVKKINNLNGNGDYITTRIGSVTGSVKIDSDYGSIGIERLTNTARNVTINSNYTSVKIGFEAGYEANFELDINYASFNGEENVTLTKSVDDRTSLSMKGFIINKNSTNKVTIKSNYGGVTFIKL